FNTTTGAFSLIGGSMTWTAIAFDENDQLFGIDIGGDALYRIDTATGNATLVGGKIGGDVRGMSFAYSRNNNVPEPGVLALVSLGLLGVAASRRKKV
ncbi:MAG: PEP-CTERM sorting domain-containing protein, partial [Rubrivivax sp.]